MGLSLSIQMDVLKAKAGHILNTFKIYPRRDVLFFEDILAQYIRECEKAGYGKEMYEIGKMWGALGSIRIPPVLLRMPPEYIINTVIKKVWQNIGLVGDLKLVRSNNTHTFTTKNEFITRAVGKNRFMQGVFVGAVAGFYKRDAVCKEFSQTKESCRYIIERCGGPFNVTSKCLDEYRRLNIVQKAGELDLKKALVRSVFNLDEKNRLTFRGRSMIFVENSGFHLIGTSGILIGRIPDITARFFKDLLAQDLEVNSSLILLKTILESSGWGLTKVEIERERITFVITNPPYGLQAETDNWTFLAYFILGYLQAIDKKIALENCAFQNGKLSISYSK